MKSFFLEKVKRYILKNKLMEYGARYLVALSGGADSVSLILSLKELGYRVEAAHCNFHLRGEESDRDESFCRDLCKREGIAIHVAHFNTREFAALHKISIEMAARRLRYSYFEQLRGDIPVAGICIGHHQEDSVETLLINLIRGTGINGLTGIAPQNGFILRPLLGVTKKDIELYLKQRRQEYVTDSTNLISDVVRNKIRLQLMPLIREINPSADRNIAETGERISGAAAVFNDSMKMAVAKVCKDDNGCKLICIEKLQKTVSPEYTLFCILSPLGFPPAMIKDIHENLGSISTGSIFEVSDYRLLADRGFLIVQRKQKETTAKEIKIPESGLYKINERLNLRFAKKEISAGFILEKSKKTATMDADLVRFPLTVRHVASGDRFIPFGMRGCKLVSDYMTDRKFSLYQKEEQLVVVDRDGNILWLVGERPDNRFRITGNSKLALIIESSPNLQLSQC